MTKTIRAFDSKSGDYVDEQVHVNPDNTVTELVGLSSDLSLDAKSLTLTTETNVGSVPIPDTVRYLGVYPKTGTDWRVGLEAPEVDGAATGNVLVTAFKKGNPVPDTTWTYFTLPEGTGRVLYVRNSLASGTIGIAIL
jgi:hypothetical protein